MLTLGANCQAHTIPANNESVHQLSTTIAIDQSKIGSQLVSLYLAWSIHIYLRLAPPSPYPFVKKRLACSCDRCDGQISSLREPAHLRLSIVLFLPPCSPHFLRRVYSRTPGPPSGSRVSMFIRTASVAALTSSTFFPTLLLARPSGPYSISYIWDFASSSMGYIYCALYTLVAFSERRWSKPPKNHDHVPFCCTWILGYKAGG